MCDTQNLHGLIEELLRPKRIWQREGSNESSDHEQTNSPLSTKRSNEVEKLSIKQVNANRKGYIKPVLLCLIAYQIAECLGG